MSCASCKKACTTKSLADYSTKGCGNFLVYDVQALPDIGYGYISISAKADLLSLSGIGSTFDISQANNLNAKIESYSDVYMPYCTDVPAPPWQVLINSWNVVSGSAEIRIVENSSDCDERYVVDVILRNAVFEDANGNIITVTEKAFLNVIVNYWIG